MLDAIRKLTSRTRNDANSKQLYKEITSKFPVVPWRYQSRFQSGKNKPFIYTHDTEHITDTNPWLTINENLGNVKGMKYSMNINHHFETLEEALDYVGEYLLGEDKEKILHDIFDEYTPKSAYLIEQKDIDKHLTND